MWNIYCNQSKFSCHESASTMLEDFAIKGLQAGYEDKTIVSSLGEYYRQCDQVAEENLARAKKILARNK